MTAFGDVVAPELPRCAFVSALATAQEWATDDLIKLSSSDEKI